MTKLTTPYGEFVVTRRATAGFSVVQVTRTCCHHGRWRNVGEYVIIEHRKLPLFKPLVCMGWCKHVATYDLAGKEIELRS
jgi:hypothetical protein